MARYQHLPLYRSCYAFSLQIYRLKVKLPKVVKHDLGQVFCETSVRCLRGIVVANGSTNKRRHLQVLLLEVETLWVYARLLYDLKSISQGEFRVLSEMLSDVTSQTQAWLKWERQNEAKNASKPPTPS